MSPAAPPVSPPSVDPTAGGARRPLKSRDTHWARTLAGSLARAGVSPNAISLLSVACAALAGACYVAAAYAGSPWLRGVLYVLAVIGIQSRLLCNLLDGMVAVEHGKASLGGEIFNDLPDRFADAVLFAAVGYSVGGPAGVSLGWAAAVMAIVTAYVRVLGKSIGGQTRFIGPMAKQHRMALLTAASLLAAVLAHWGRDRRTFAMTLGVIIVGCAATVVRRLRLTAADLREKQGKAL
jgi:phosphatidylglycerophosphate synthase